MNENKKQQVVVIGAGPGGYAAAFHAADLGLSVTLVDIRDNPGGVCLFEGCIPTKSLIHVAKVITEARDVSELGIDFPAPKIDLEKIRVWKNSVVTKLTGGLGQLSRQRKIQFIQGRASFLDSETLKIDKQNGETTQLAFDHAVLATGSRPIPLPFAPTSERVMDSSSALMLNDVPARLLVIGGGYIGLEFGTVYQALGSHVSVVEMTPTLLPGVENDLVDVLTKRMGKSFTAIKLNTRVTGIKEITNGLTVSFESQQGERSQDNYDKILVAIGRKPVTDGLGLENTRVELTDRSFIKVDLQRRTTDPRIFAIGDIAGNPMLAHKATHEGIVAAEAIAGQKTVFEPKAIPAVVFTDPEIAWCGLTEAQAQAEGRSVKVVKFPWAASGRALTLNRAEGFTRLVIDEKNGRVLGAAIVGPGAGELISEGVLAVEMAALAKDVALSIHPHPTLSETVMEAAEMTAGSSLHIFRPRKS